jgi:3-methyladenine DNA glycosylase Tag
MPNMEWQVSKPKSDDEYFERLTRAIFQAGLNWKMIDTKWPNFQKAFSQFSIKKIAKYDDRKVGRLMSDASIVRNEGKIKSTIYNATQAMEIEKEFGSFEKYFKSFGKNHAALQADLQSRFHHVGDSSSRTFLWMSGVKLTPTAEEKAWLAHNK